VLPRRAGLQEWSKRGAVCESTRDPREGSPPTNAEFGVDETIILRRERRSSTLDVGEPDAVRAR